MFSVFLSSRAVPATPGECLGASAQISPEACGLRVIFQRAASPSKFHEATSGFAARYSPTISQPPACRPRGHPGPASAGHLTVWRRGAALPYYSAIHRGGLLSSTRNTPLARRTKMRLRRWPDDGRSGSGNPPRWRAISWADGRSAGRRRICASAGRCACGAFFDLTPRASRIAPRPDMLRRNPLTPRCRSADVLWECDVADCTRSKHDSRNFRDVTFCRRVRRGRRDRSRNSFGT